ncbi:MAG: hypothetical protein VX017_06400, partial [Pseudomonadota bacterium]|nr:hypothetical protein [Pseudomonadota bacterium]
MTSLSQSLSLWLQTPVFWMLIAALFLGLELINRRMVLFLPVAVASLIVAALLQPLPPAGPQWSLVPTGWPSILALWALLSLIGSTACTMLRRRRSRRSATAGWRSDSRRRRRGAPVCTSGTTDGSRCAGAGERVAMERPLSMSAAMLLREASRDCAFVRAR